jgi:hypothetical protein
MSGELVDVVLLSVDCNYFDKRSYSFSFVVENKNTTFLMSKIAQMIPQDDLQSFSIRKNEIKGKKPIELTKSLADIVDIIYSKTGQSEMKLILKGGNKGEKH